MAHRTSIAIALLCALLAGPAAADAETWSALGEAFQNAARSVEQAVVRIEVEREPEEPVTNPYFARPDAPVSGVLVDPRGFVLTSEWNVTGTLLDLSVELADGRIYDANLKAIDGNLDLALLELVHDGETFPYVSIDAGVTSTVGQFAVVVGRTSFTGYNMTSGIVSAVKRQRGMSDQLDALVSFGNAGGAVVDLRGGLLGIVSRVRGGAEQGQNSGVGFFAPARLVAESLPTLLAGENVARKGGGFLGVRPDNASTALDGATIAEVIEGTAAEQAGMQDGDKITMVDDEPIPDFFILVGVLQQKSPGDAIKITVVRGDETLVLDVVLGARPEEGQQPDEEQPDEEQPDDEQPDSPDEPDSPDNPDNPDED